MPLVRITLAQGKDAAWRRSLADAVHQALVETAGVPAEDRFQIVHEVPPADLIADPGYLGFTRTKSVVLIQVFLNAGRSVDVKRALYARIAQEARVRCGLRPDDLLVSLVEVPRENWSFGGGVMSYPPTP
jgi:phenylpyruvate tautomerase PptA (4-oxalocrotonate tautomerase family)